jgi:hypothetical protein
MTTYNIFSFDGFDGFADSETPGHQVVVFPGTLTFRAREDKALYALAMIARDAAGGRRSLMPVKRGARKTGLENPLL